MFPVLPAANENTSLLQVDKEEVRLRRTVASKKDEYYLDGKHVRHVIVLLYALNQSGNVLSYCLLRATFYCYVQ
jgi:hypothetical protein